MDLFTLLEDRTQGYLHLLKGSKAKLPKRFMIGGEVFTPDDVDTPTGEPAQTLGELGSLHQDIISEIEETIDDDVKKYEEYFVQQVANGTFPINKIREDGERFNITLRLFQKLSRKAIWKGPKNVFQWPSWRELEKATRALAKEANIPEDDTGARAQDSVVLFSKSYQDTRSEIFTALFDDPAAEAGAVRTYYLRKILTPEGACKYGKGTTWCTATKNIKKQLSVDDLKAIVMPIISQRQGGPGLFDPFALSRSELLREWCASGQNHHYYLFTPQGTLSKEALARLPEDLQRNVLDFVAGKVDWLMNPSYYLGHAMNYIRKGLYIIELEDENPRRPILQMSQGDIMNVEDTPVTKAGLRLADFIKSAQAAVKDDELENFHHIL